MKTIQIISARTLSADIKKAALTDGISINDFDFLIFGYEISKYNIDIIEQNTTPFVFTSKHAINSIANLLQNNTIQLKNKTCFAISGTTSALATQNGFEVLDEAVDSFTLAKKISATIESKILHCTTKIRLDDLSNTLRFHNILVNEIEVYQKKMNSIILNEPYDGIMFFSPSQVDSFLQHNKLLNNIPAFCIGNTTAKYLQNKNHNNCITATKPSIESMLEAINNYFLNKF